MDNLLSLSLEDACIKGNLKKVKELVGIGADINQTLCEGKTAICWSVSGGHYDLTKYLVDEGANVNFQEEDEGESVLIFALQDLDGEGMVLMMKLLLDSGALVDQPDFLGWTPLIHATSYISFEAVEVLLKYHANPDFRVSDQNDSALTICEDEGIKALLLSSQKLSEA
ncbi:MAG: ankyrin repeat domain-containing protein [Deltaproteobacteria bacterium]|nr:ankyrin repeat domain-containing protein [Deltaproteobacteria bacterium]